jgi:hypothetical protein
MTRLMIIPLAALAFALTPLGPPPSADDAHHPEKAAKAGKSIGAKGKQTKKPAAKPKKASAYEGWLMTPLATPDGS